jgi:hypothetical protein
MDALIKTVQVGKLEGCASDLDGCFGVVSQGHSATSRNDMIGDDSFLTFDISFAVLMD